MLPIVTLNYAPYYGKFLHLIQNAETLTQEIDTLILCVVQKKFLHCYFIIVEQLLLALQKCLLKINCCAYNRNIFAKGENYSLGLFNVLWIHKCLGVEPSSNWVYFINMYNRLTARAASCDNITSSQRAATIYYTKTHAQMSLMCDKVHCQ